MPRRDGYPFATSTRATATAFWITSFSWMNMTGSFFFAVSAWGAKMLPNNQLQSQDWSDFGTALGALGFFVAALLTWPDREATHGA